MKNNNKFFYEKNGNLYFKNRISYDEWWIQDYEINTGRKYLWWLPVRAYTWNEYRPYVDKFMTETFEMFYYQGFLKALYSHFIVMYFFCFLIVWLIIVYVAAVLTLDERKLIATIQNRHGPARVGYGGLLQPIADAIKMLIKEFIYPNRVRTEVFKHSAFLSFFFASFFWMALPYNGEFNFCVTEFTLLFLVLVSLLHAYTVLSAGWASNSKYSFLGGVRTASQLISYDIVIIFVLINIYLNVKTLNLQLIVEDQYNSGSLIKFIPWIAITFIISFLAETSRHPYDLPEAEAELVSGYNVEYSSIRFAMFFLAEYASVVYVSLLFLTIFLNTSNNFENDFLFEIVKMFFILLLSIFLRSLIPRYRYDQLMKSCWKTHIPIGCITLFLNLLLYIIF